jgi:hypothetical protein
VIPAELEDSAEDIPVPEPAPAEEEVEPLPTSARLGMVALFLGVASILVLCLPFIGGYFSIGLSGVGLFLALGGLLRVRIDGDEAMSRNFAGGAGIFGDFGARARDYPLAGVGACMLALVLALLPSLFN